MHQGEKDAQSAWKFLLIQGLTEVSDQTDLLTFMIQASRSVPEGQRDALSPYLQAVLLANQINWDAELIPKIKEMWERKVPGIREWVDQLEKSRIGREQDLYERIAAHGTQPKANCSLGVVVELFPKKPRR